jgi:hypothetical protein
VQSLASRSRKKTSSETQCSVLPLGDLDCVSAQLEVVRANGISTMEMVKSLVDMVSTLASEVQQLKTDNHALKTQLRDLQQVPSMRCEATSSAPSATSASASTAMKKSYMDIVCAVGGYPGSTVGAAPYMNLLPELSIVTGVHPSKDDFVTVVRKK